VSSRLLALLFAFQPDHSSLSLADLARRSGLPHATARRLVLELAAAGALDRLDDGRFAIGLRLWQLGTLAPHTEPLRILAKPVLEDLYAGLHQHVQLAVLEDDHAVLIERMSAPDSPHLVSRVGGRLPLHCSAVGKVLLAHGGAERVERILGGSLRAYTPHTTVDPKALRRDLAAARQMGIATVREELTVGAESMATRVVDGQGRVVAALSVVVRAGSVRLSAATPAVVTSGLRLSRLLGWHPGIAVQTG
jgi:DNA-binding IclR family transcriptional regulator